MSDSKLCHDLNRFLELLGYEDDRMPKERIVEAILSQKNKGWKSDLLNTTLNKLDRVSDKKFRIKYEKLKTKNLPEVDSLTYMLARIATHSELPHFFKLHQILANRSSRSSIGNSNNLNLTSGNSSKIKQGQTTTTTTEMTNHNISAHSTMDENANGGNVSCSIQCSPKDTKEANEVERDHSIKLKQYRLEKKNFLDGSGFTLDYNQRRETKFNIQPLSELSVLEQEKRLINDLLQVLVGIDGKYIRVQSGPSKRYLLSLSQECDPLLKMMVDRIITICPYYSLVVHFSEQHNNCLVNQALNAFIRSNIKEYFILVSQLEMLERQENLTLQRMWYFLQPFLQNFELMKSICIKIKQGNCVGGAVLSILHEKTLSCVGNLKAYQFCLNMTRTACEPYFRILENWLTNGTIYDPHGEFFIESNDQLQMNSVGEDFYWENCFHVIKNRVPLFLQNYTDKILMTGKYISVIQQSVKEKPNLPECGKFEYTGEERSFYERIENSYTFVSKLLLNLMLSDFQLIDHIKTIKHYFLMDKSDYVEEFMHVARDELRKEIDDLVPTRLESLLELAIRTSVISNDQHADNLRIELVNESILYQFSKILSYGSEEMDEQIDDFGELKGYEAVALKYEIGWPITLILNQSSLKCYQMLFQYLFYCKNIETQLKGIWIIQKNGKKNNKINQSSRTIVFLQQKMINFVQNLEYYMMVEVIEPNFHIFLEKVEGRVNSVDEMIQEHNRFVELILNSCMMNEKYAFRYVAKLLCLCVDFVNILKRYGNEKEMKNISEEHLTEINRLHEDFVFNFKKLLNEIINQQRSNYSANMLHILYRLDFNEFYSYKNVAESS